MAAASAVVRQQRPWPSSASLARRLRARVCPSHAHARPPQRWSRRAGSQTYLRPCRRAGTALEAHGRAPPAAMQAAARRRRQGASEPPSLFSSCCPLPVGASAPVLQSLFPLLFAPSPAVSRIVSVNRRNTKNRVKASCRPQLAAQTQRTRRERLGRVGRQQLQRRGAYGTFRPRCPATVCVHWTPELLASDQSGRAERTRAPAQARSGVARHGRRLCRTRDARTVQQFVPFHALPPPLAIGDIRTGSGALWAGTVARALSSRLRAPLAAALLECSECVPAEGPDEINAMRKSSGMCSAQHLPLHGGES